MCIRDSSGTDQTRRYRMATAGTGDVGFQAPFENLAGGRARQDIAQCRARKAESSRKCGARCGQNGTAVLHITDDIFQIHARQNPTTPVPVEDDQIEIVDLHLEQFADRIVNQ